MNTIKKPLLIIYEIADRASRVTSKTAFRQFERWIKKIVRTYQDEALEQVARIHLFRLKELYG